MEYIPPAGVYAAAVNSAIVKGIQQAVEDTLGEEIERAVNNYVTNALIAAAKEAKEAKKDELLTDIIADVGKFNDDIENVVKQAIFRGINKNYSAELR